PDALGNLSLAYNGSSGTLDARADINELSMPVPVLVCELLKRGTPGGVPDALGKACGKLAPVLDGIAPLPSGQEVITALQTGQLPPVPGLALPTAPAVPPAPQAALPLPAVPGAPTSKPEDEHAPQTSEK